jgi:hypothetical protein
MIILTTPLRGDDDTYDMMMNNSLALWRFHGCTSSGAHYFASLSIFFEQDTYINIS